MKQGNVTRYTPGISFVLFPTSSLRSIWITNLYVVAVK